MIYEWDDTLENRQFLRQITVQVRIDGQKYKTHIACPSTDCVDLQYHVSSKSVQSYRKVNIWMDDKNLS